MPNFVLGMNGAAYYGNILLAGQDEAAFDAVTWTKIDNIRDVNLDLSTGEADITTRGNLGWRQTTATLKEGTVETQIVWKPGDPFFDAVQTAWLASTEIAMAFLDQLKSVAGAQGLVSNFVVTNFTRGEALEEAMVATVTLKPSSFTQWLEIVTP